MYIYQRFQAAKSFKIITKKNTAMGGKLSGFGILHRREPRTEGYRTQERAHIIVYGVYGAGSMEYGVWSTLIHMHALCIA